MKFGKEEEDNFQDKPIIKNSLSNNNNNNANTNTTKTILGKSSLFKFSKQQYDSNMITINKLIKKVEEIDKNNFIDKLNEFYGFLMSIPYKYGIKYIEIGIDKESKYLTKLGLPYLIKELEKEEIVDKYKESLLKEIKEEFPLILDNFLVQQMKIKFYSEDYTTINDEDVYKSKKRELKLLKKAFLKEEDTKLSIADIENQYNKANLKSKEIDEAIKKSQEYIREDFTEYNSKNLSDLNYIEGKINDPKIKKNELKSFEELKKSILKLQNPTESNEKTKSKNEKTHINNINAIQKKIGKYRDEVILDKSYLEKIAQNLFDSNSDQNTKEIEACKNLIQLYEQKEEQTKVTNKFYTIKKKLNESQELENKAQELENNIESDQNTEQLKEIKQRIASINEELTKVQTDIDQTYKIQQDKIKTLQKELDKEKYKKLADILKHSTDYLKQVQLKTLQEYQEDYEKRTLKEKLRFYESQIKAANSNNTILVAIANFYAWVKEGISKELKSKIVELLPKDKVIKEGKETATATTYLKYIRDIRHQTMHGLDDIGRSNALFQNIYIDKSKKAFIALITYLEQNIDYLNGKTLQPNTFIDARELEPIINLANNLKKASMELDEKGEKLSPSSNKQIAIFKSSIVIGKKIISELYTTLQKDLDNGMTIEQLVTSFNKMNSEQNMDKQELQFILKYDSALQALGQAIGNLQQYEELPDIDKLGINDEEDNFILLKRLIPSAKDYRTSCTHHCYYNKDFVDFILNRINSYNTQINHELDLLYEKVREAYLEAGNKEFDNIYEAEKEQQNFVSMVTNRLPEAECKLH